MSPNADQPGAAAFGRRRMAGAAFWAASGFLARQGLRLGGNLVFARLLFPEAFGLMALVNAFRTGLELASDVGIAPSIVQNRRGSEEAFLNTAWTLQIGRGLLLFSVCVLLAGPVASLYDQPILAGLLRVAAVAFLFSGLDSTSMAKMQRDLSIRAFEGVQLAGQLSSVTTILIWLLIEPTVWALVAGGVVASVVRLALSHALAPRRDRLGWEPRAAREILDFGKWILVSTLFTFLADQGDRLILGKLVDVGTLGVFSIAAMFSALPALLAHQLCTLVLFPALSRSRETGGDLDHAYRRARQPVLVVGGWATACLAAGAIPLIDILYDARYGAAGWMLQLLAVGTWFRIAESPGRSALLALGETRWMALLNGVKLVGVVVGLPLGYAIYGFVGAICALIASDAARYLVCSLGVYRHGLRGFSADAALTLSFATALALGAIVVSHMSQSGYSSTLQLFGGWSTALLVFAPVGLPLLVRSRAHEFLRL